MKKNIFWLLLALFTMLFSISVFATETETETDTDLKINVSHFDSEYQIEEYVDEDGFVPVMYNEAKTAIARIEKIDYDRTFTVYHKGIVYMFRRNPAPDDTEPLVLNSMALNSHTTWGLYWVDNAFQMSYSSHYSSYLKALLMDGYGWTQEEWSKFLSYDYKMYAVASYFDVTYRTSTVDLGDEDFEPIDVNNGYYQYAYVINECKDYFLSDKLFGSDGTSVDKDYLEDRYNDATNTGDGTHLPMLHYKLSSKNVISFPNIIDKKISIDWDFASLEPYASDPMSYAIEIIISAHFYPNSEGLRNCWDASKTSINNDCKRVISAERSLLDKPYSFIYLKEGDALYSSSNHIFATDELQDGYYLYIRSYSKDGTKSSNYKVYKCTTGGTSGQMELTYDIEGNEYELEESDKDEEQEYSNEYDEDSSSSADKTPTGDSYDGNGGYSFDTLYGNLTSMVNMLQGVPELWAYVMSWLPEWFPTFIVTMMGLLIVIGVLKYIF